MPFDLPENADDAAHFLLGKVIVRTLADGTVLSGWISETESYTEDDPASHSFCGKTERNKVMFGPPFFAYVYKIYGIHNCLNVVTGAEDSGNAVLIRSIVPLQERATMIKLRNVLNWPEQRIDKELCNGPGKVCQALDIDLTLNGHDYLNPPLQIIDDGFYVPEKEIIRTPRIGITKAADKLRRFVWVSS